MKNIRRFQGIEPRIGKRVYVDPAAVVIGDVKLGDDASIWPLAVVRGDVNRITVGARTSVQDGSVLHVTHDGQYTPGGCALNIGNNVTIGHRVTLHGCAVGDGCLIGMGATIMDGAILGDHVLVGAGCLVSPGKVLAPRTLYVGTPAKRVRDLSEAEVEMLDYSAAHYVRLKDKYL